MGEPLRTFAPSMQVDGMFDWTDLLFLLPERVFWACFAVFIVLVVLLVIWTGYL